MKPKQIKWNRIKPTVKRTHATQPRERSQEENRVWEIGIKRFLPMMADREVRDGGGGNRFSEWRWQSVLEATVASMRGSGGGVVLRVRVCLRVQRREWLIWASVERSELQLRVRVFLFLRVSFSRVWCLGFLFFYFFFNFFIYTKLRAAFHKTQLCMNWSCVLLNAAL